MGEYKTGKDEKNKNIFAKKQKTLDKQGGFEYNNCCYLV